jgi:hypothetical protein
MGVINAENTLQFKSSQQMFDRIKKRLSSFDAEDLIDDGDFHKHVVYILEELGASVHRECEAVLSICDSKSKMPDNFKEFYAAWRASSKGGWTKSINEQKPLIYYQDTEITRECPSPCKFECGKDDYGKMKIVIRTFVNGEDNHYYLDNFCGLTLSPHRTICNNGTGQTISRAYENEIYIDDKGFMHTGMKDGYVYMQYWGTPIDENGLPMIPKNESVERAIEYYIYTQLFEEFYWNSTVQNIGNMLQDARNQYDFYMAQARYWAKLPSFKKMVNAIRRMRGQNKFFNYISDRTVVI